MRKIKNEFMSMWDGLKTKDNERVIVLAATNRPFDLDDAVLRRMPRRLLVDLPDALNREKIIRVMYFNSPIFTFFFYVQRSHFYFIRLFWVMKIWKRISISLPSRR